MVSVTIELWYIDFNSNYFILFLNEFGTVDSLMSSGNEVHDVVEIYVAANILLGLFKWML